MAEAALKTEIHELAPVRRFEIADLSTHGPWLMKRFIAAFPDFTEQAIAGYLRGLIYNNEHIFLYQDNAVALAQLVHSPGIRTMKVLQERFVWVKDRDDKQQLADAADFYEYFKTWAKRQDIERIIVCESTDVPKSLIEAHLGRLFDTKISHARI
jgi:hypothetical protein